MAKKEDKAMDGLKYFTEPLQELKENLEKETLYRSTLEQYVKEGEMLNDERVNELSDKLVKSNQAHCDRYEKCQADARKLESRLNNIENELPGLNKLLQRVEKLEAENKLLKANAEGLDQRVQLLQKLAVHLEQLKEKQDKDLCAVNAYLEKRLADLCRKQEDLKHNMQVNAKEEAEGAKKYANQELLEKQVAINEVQEKANLLAKKNDDLDRKIEQLYAQLNDKLNNVDKGLNSEDVRLLIKKYKFA